MTTYVALLRAVNVGGTGKLPMAELRAMCTRAGFSHAQTYIASGNVAFESNATPERIKRDLESQLQTFANKPVGVLVRTAAEMQAVLNGNPFPHAAPNRTVAIFLDKPPTPEDTTKAGGLTNEELEIGEREIYVHYPDGQSKSKLKLPATKNGTARNMNTIAKLADIAARLGSS